MYFFVYILTDNKNEQDIVENEPTNNLEPNLSINPNQNPEEEEDRNSQILARLASLRRLRSSIRGGGSFETIFS